MTERHELDPLHRFSNRVDAYNRYRPGYPPELLDWLSESAGLSPSWRIADVGSGTGLLSLRFIENGNTVYGVEPNAPMRASAESLFAGNHFFISVVGSAEATTLPDHSVDLIAAAQAFHWFRLQETSREWRRVLKPGGWALIVFNTRLIDATPFMRAYEQHLLDQAVDYAGVDHTRGLGQRLREFFANGTAEWRFRYTLRHQYQDVRGLSMSSSYVPAPGHPNYDAFFTGLRDVFDEHAVDGVVEFPYETEAYLGKV